MNEPSPHLVLLVATRKGAWLFHGDAGRDAWQVDGPHFLGHTVSHLKLDPRDGRTLLAAARTGHLGPTVFRSTDGGRHWQEAARPPAFDPPRNGLPARSVDHTFWLTPGHAGQPGTWWAGTSPQGLFRSGDGGATWSPLPSVNDDPQFREWMGTVQDGTPDGPKLHSITVDPRDPERLLFAMSGGGVHESADGGRSWRPLVDGMEVVEGFDPATVTFHDPHCVRLCPSRPDRLYQQNHCGLYRLDRPGTTWRRIGRTMPAEVGDIGFPMVVHPHDADTAWVFPMDGTDVWPRTSPGGRPAAYATHDGGQTWQRRDEGLPPGQAWWTVKRQAMTADARPQPALYLGTTSGETVGSATTAAGAGRRSRATCRRSTRSRWPRWRHGRDRAGAGRAALVHRRRAGARRGRHAARAVRRPGPALARAALPVVDEQRQLRANMRLFVNGRGTRDLGQALGPGDFVAIVLALSGG